ncbi:hypothetical protein T484DRAFT_1741399 [Baffinella frigidus]|nr:hypothetical protein T484DRAFT_1741399 [Cryptophyta sp. CCMP2293]
MALLSLLAASLQLSSFADAFAPAVGRYVLPPLAGSVVPRQGFASKGIWGAGIRGPHGVLPSRRAFKHAGPAMMADATDRLVPHKWIAALASAPLARATSVTFRRIMASFLLCTMLLTSAISAFPSRASANPGPGSLLSADVHAAAIAQSGSEASRSVPGAVVRNIPGANRLAFVTPQEATGASQATPRPGPTHGLTECMNANQQLVELRRVALLKNGVAIADAGVPTSLSGRVAGPGAESLEKLWCRRTVEGQCCIEESWY